MNEAAPIAATSAVPVYAPGPVPAVGGKVGVLLVNLGTPDGADAASVRRYLKEFLSDARVIEDQGLLWKLILNGITNLDVNLVQGVVLTISVTFVLVNIAVDLLYLLINPRIRTV